MDRHANDATGQPPDAAGSVRQAGPRCELLCRGLRRVPERAKVRSFVTHGTARTDALPKARTFVQQGRACAGQDRRARLRARRVTSAGYPAQGRCAVPPGGGGIPAPTQRANFCARRGTSRAWTQSASFCVPGKGRVQVSSHGRVPWQAGRSLEPKYGLLWGASAVQAKVRAFVRQVVRPPARRHQSMSTGFCTRLSAGFGTKVRTLGLTHHVRGRVLAQKFAPWMISQICTALFRQRAPARHRLAFHGRCAGCAQCVWKSSGTGLAASFLISQQAFQ